jgi:hypothetical protein
MRVKILIVLLFLTILISGCATPGGPGNITGATFATLPTRIVSVNIQSINIIMDGAGVPVTASFTVQAQLRGKAEETVNYACKAIYFDNLVDPGINLRRQISSTGEMTNTFTFSTSARGKSPEKNRWGVCCDLLPLNAFIEKTTATVCVKEV